MNFSQAMRMHRTSICSPTMVLQECVSHLAETVERFLLCGADGHPMLQISGAKLVVFILEAHLMNAILQM